MVRIRDVADAAGVSPMTVSNVINAHPHVRAETRERVLRAIDALGYRVNLAARNLRTGRTGTIGLAVPDLDNHYFSHLSAQIVAAASAHGYRVAIEQTGAVRDNELDVVASSRSRLHDGLLLSTIGLGPDDAHLLRVDHPVVLLGESIFGGPIDHIAMPNVDGSRAAVQHLIDRGCQRIALLDRPRPDDEGPEDLRLQGYLQALGAAGIPHDPAYIFGMETFSMASGELAAHAAVASGLPIDGVFCPTDAVAIGAIRGFADRGIRVPDDLLVIGFDDLPESSFTVPRLSTVAPDHRVTAETAVDYLLERIDGTAPPAAREFIPPFTIIERESTSR